MKRIKLLKLLLIFGIFFTIGIVQIQFTVAEKKNFNLKRIGKFDDGGRALGVFFGGGPFVYVVDGEQGLEIIDATHIENCSLIGKYNPHAGEPQDVYINGSYAFLANDFNGIRTINISDPKHPSIISHFVDEEYIGYITVSKSDSLSVVVNDSFVYIADGKFGVKVLDFTDPFNPTKVGEYTDEKGSASNIIVNDSYAYVANGEDGVEILDLSDLSNITRIGHYYDGGRARDIFLSGPYLFVADHDNGLEILDVSDPYNPIEIGEFYDGSGLSLGVFVVEDRAFVADNVDGLEVFDISDLTAPVEVGQFYEETGIVGLASDVVVNGSFIFVAFGTQGLEILTYGTPRTPIPILPLTFVGIIVLAIGIWIIWGGKSQ